MHALYVCVCFSFVRIFHCALCVVWWLLMNDNNAHIERPGSECAVEEIKSAADEWRGRLVDLF